MISVLPLHRPPHVLGILLTSTSLTYHPPVPLNTLCYVKPVPCLLRLRTIPLYLCYLAQDSSICLHLLALPID